MVIPPPLVPVCVKSTLFFSVSIQPFNCYLLQGQGAPKAAKEGRRVRHSIIMLVKWELCGGGTSEPSLDVFLTLGQ